MDVGARRSIVAVLSAWLLVVERPWKKTRSGRVFWMLAGEERPCGGWCEGTHDTSVDDEESAMVFLNLVHIFEEIGEKTIHVFFSNNIHKVLFSCPF
jgi:hypothetical protein